MTKSKTKPRRLCVLILEDQQRVADALEDAIREERSDIYVCSASTIDDAWAELDQSEKEFNCEVAGAIVDQVKGTPRDPKGVDRDWGLRFLRGFRKAYPDAFRVLFSGQSKRDDIQTALDEQLIHHFESKTRHTKATEDLSDEVNEAFRDALISTVINMLHGRPAGNVRSPDVDLSFRRVVRAWAGSLPDGEDTRIMDLGSGQDLTVRDFIDDPELLELLREAHATSTLDDFVQIPDDENSDNGGAC